MPKLVLQSLRHEVRRCILIPAVAIVTISLILWAVKQHAASYSVFWGGIVWVIPNGFVATWLFSNVSSRAAGRIVFKFYLAEGIKLLITALLFIGIVKFFPLSLGFFLIGYLVAQVSFWVTAGLSFR